MWTRIHNERDIRGTRDKFYIFLYINIQSKSLNEKINPFLLLQMRQISNINNIFFTDCLQSNVVTTHYFMEKESSVHDDMLIISKIDIYRQEFQIGKLKLRILFLLGTNTIDPCILRCTSVSFQINKYCIKKSEMNFSNYPSAVQFWTVWIFTIINTWKNVFYKSCREYNCVKKKLKKIIFCRTDFGLSGVNVSNHVTVYEFW